MKKIDFDNLDKQTVVILCQRTENILDIKSQLEAKSYKVLIETSTTNFMNHLDKARPGFVLISKRLTSPLALQLPIFLQKKYKIPVMLFGENEPHSHLSEHLNEGHQTQSFEQEGTFKVKSPYIRSNSEIVNLASDLDSTQLAEKISSFETNYKKQFQKTSPATESLSKKAVKEIESKIVKPSPVNWEAETPLTLHSLQVKDPAGDGYFIIALPEVENELEQQYMLSDLQAQIQEHIGEDATIDQLTTHVKFSQYQEMTSNSDKILKGVFGETEIMIAFSQKAPDIDLTTVKIVDDAFLVPIEKWWTEIPLNFRVYHYMPVNNRKLLYVRQGKMLHPETFFRFQKRGVKQMLIPAEELDAYKRLNELMDVVKNQNNSASKSKEEDDSEAA